MIEKNAMTRSVIARVIQDLESGNVLCLGTLHAFSDFESHFLTFIERDTTAGGVIDLTEVNENIVSTVVLLNETVTFFVVEPFDGSVMQFCHDNTF